MTGAIPTIIIIAALCSRCGHYIIFLPWGFFIFFLSLPNLSCRTLDVYHTSAHGVALVKFGCMSETCSMRLAGNAVRKKSPKIRHLGIIAQLCRAISLQLRHVLTIEKNLLSSNISSTYPHNMVNLGPLAVEIGPVVWGTPANFNGFLWLFVGFTLIYMYNACYIILHNFV